VTLIKRDPPSPSDLPSIRSSDLELHYRDTVLLIQRLVLRRATWPFTKIVGLTDTEVGQIAALLAEAHTVATEQEATA
jgi:hypothetical protein